MDVKSGKTYHESGFNAPAIFRVKPERLDPVENSGFDGHKESSSNFDRFNPRG
jgi:hypothetical protein